MHAIKRTLATFSTLALVALAPGIAAADDVTVANTPQNPVPTVAVGRTMVQSVDEPARQPYQASVSLDFGKQPGTEGSTFKTVFLPPGKRLVIEYVSAGIALSGVAADNFIARASVATTFDGDTVTHFFVPTLRGKDLGSQLTGYSLGQVTRLYTDGKFVVTVIPNNLPNTGVAGVSISGYLVDIAPQRQ